MSLVRILVDGYSLLHNWTELAPGKPRYSAAAREDLIAVLTHYHDACGTPITVVALLYLAITLPLTRLAASLERRGAGSR